MKRTRLTLLCAIALALCGGATCWLGQPPSPTASPPPPAEINADPIGQLTSRATNGDAGAQLQLGLSCLERAGQKPDPRQASEWLGKAAAAGNAEAQYRLATLYQTGRGVPRDPTNAILWFQKAAEQHHVAALYNLGSMYEAGQGVPADTQAAARFFLQAADLGDGYAQYNLARRFEEGHGVARDLVQAWKYYELANAGEVPDTLNARQAIASRLTTDEFRRARQAVEEVRRQAKRQKPRTP